MTSILVISPDPETRRMFELAFELKGANVHSAVDSTDPAAKSGADAIILDLVDPDTQQWADSKNFLLKSPSAKGKPALVILPRGKDVRSAAISFGSAILVKRPYVLLDTVERVLDEAKAKHAKPKSKRPMKHTARKVAPKKQKPRSSRGSASKKHN